MADVTQNVIIQFISDDSQLQTSNDRLEEQGIIEKKNGDEFKRTNAEIIKQQKALADIGNVTKQIDATGKVTKKKVKPMTDSDSESDATPKPKKSKKLAEIDSDSQSDSNFIYYFIVYKIYYHKSFYLK